jgi:hypothetical protein
MLPSDRPPPGSNMPIQPQELIVREHERLACRLEATLHIDSPGVVLSGGAADANDAVSAVVVDCSAGGAGLQTTVFLPRGLRLRLHIAPLAPAPLGGTSPAWALEAPVRIQRVTMVSREPMYYLGTAFTDLDQAELAMLARVLNHLRDSGSGVAGA